LIVFIKLLTMSQSWRSASHKLKTSYDRLKIRIVS